ncbi:MAG: M1 family metallopeptidase [Ignavibacteria bacterium]|nr:M1 family metallopeptidase [Ignavibacteria bacterium]
MTHSRSYILGLLIMILYPSLLHSQAEFTRADSLRGGLSKYRTCYDVLYYHLDVRVDPEAKRVDGSNLIRYRVTEPFRRMQLDLFPSMIISDIRTERGEQVRYVREEGAVFLDMPSENLAGETGVVIVRYGGIPISAERPPWSGGFTWTTDAEGNPWIAVSCQGTGASLWWPNKDHQADEPDSMLISVTVPSGLQNISNGRLRSVSEAEEGWSRFDWFVGNPINNYNVTVNIGAYDHFSDSLIRNGDTLSLDYYVLPYNREKAARQFRQVRPTLETFEKYFGRYPFSDDGYKLVETPYLGMEHQSAIAYGNQYMNGYAGTAQSAVGPSSSTGLLFDFIIVHETAHEWWGNSVTAKDIADMWIHESFGAYAEAIFVEEQWGYEAAIDYINAKKSSVANDRPMTGVYNVHNSGSRDMYNKGQLALNTLRHEIGNDELWWDLIRGLATTFRMKTVTAEEIITFINERTETDYTPFFDQYFRASAIPELQVYITRQGPNTVMQYRWDADARDFSMNLSVTTGPDRFETIRPTTSWQTMNLDGVDPREFRIADDLFYVTMDLRWAYLAPEKTGEDFLRRP